MTAVGTALRDDGRAQAGLVAAAAGLAYAVVRPVAPDLPAQVARAAAASRGAGFWWAGWYDGLNTATYSLLSGRLMAMAGVATVGVVATVVLAVGTADLLRGSARPRAGAVAFALAAAADLWSGRLTFSAGMAVAVLACCALRRGHRWTALGLALLTGPVSPLAALALAVGLSALAVLDTARRWRLLGLAAAAVAPVLAVSAVFGQPSFMPFDAPVLHLALLACAGVLLAPVPAQVRVLAALAAVVAVGAYVVPSPVGKNAARLPMLLAAPLVVATARRGPLVPGLVPGVLAAGLLVWPATSFRSDLRIAAQASTSAAFSAPLLAQLPPPGTASQRVEVVQPESQAPADTVARRVPLARGWERQADAAQNPLFYDGTLTADRYRDWLVRRGVGWVAVPRAPLDYGAQAEAGLVGRGLPYLGLQWQDRDWRLYRVQVPAPVATGALVATALDDTGVTATAEAAGPARLAVTWSRLLVLRSLDRPDERACVRPGPDGAVVVDVPAAGRWVLRAEAGALLARCR